MTASSNLRRPESIGLRLLEGLLSVRPVARIQRFRGNITKQLLYVADQPYVEC